MDNYNDLKIKGKGGLLRAYLRFAAATVASLMVYSMYSMVDGLFVSHGVNEYAMSAVNLAIPYTNVLFSLAVLFAVGSSTLIAIFLGQNKREEANRLFSQNVLTLTVVGLLLTAVVLVFPDSFARLLGADAQTLDYTKEYLKGLAPFSVCFMISYNLEILIKTDGYPQKAFWTVLTGCVLNCVMDYVSIFLLHMGVFGAALATGLSQMIVCLLYFWHFIRGRTTFRFARFHFDFAVLKRLVPLGIPDGVTELFNGLMIFVFNRVIQSRLGADGLVCYTIIAYVNTVVINCFVGVSTAVQPLTSFCHGRGEERDCRQLLRYAMTLAGILGAVIYASLYFGSGLLAAAFLGTDEADLNVMSSAALRRYIPAYLVIGFNLVAGGYLTARERPGGALCITAGRGFLLQSAALLLLSMLPDRNAIWFSPLCGEVLCLALSVCFLRRMRQTQNENSTLDN